MTGVVFLGAGAILHVGARVSGLTSAAVIWFLGAIGVLIGCGFPLSAIVLVVAALGLMRLLGHVERLLPIPPERHDA